MKKRTQKTYEKRVEERKDFPAFYLKHIERIKKSRAVCEECGIRLLGDVSEVAHILSKGTYKSISTEDDNVIYLCGWKQNNCHDKFDSGRVTEMKIHSKVKEKFYLLKDKIQEKINHKIWERYAD